MSDPKLHVDIRRFARVRRTHAYRCLVEAGTNKAILACSGGADSMALLAITAVARDAGRVGPVVVAHVDHGLRAGSLAEGRVVASVCRAFNVPFVQLRGRRSTVSDRDGPEAALRAMRYDALATLARRVGVFEVLTAHTEGDQLETVLMRLISGAGPLATAGMSPRQVLSTTSGDITIVRPLLTAKRSELEDILTLLDLPYVDDPSNQDVEYRRNRLRHRVIPELERVDAGFGRGILRSVNLARQDADLVDQIAGEYIRSQIGRTRTGKRTLPRTLICEVHPAIASRLMMAAILELLPQDNRELTEERIDAITRAASGSSGKVIEIPYGLQAVIERDEIVITRVGGDD